MAFNHFFSTPLILLNKRGIFDLKKCEKLAWANNLEVGVEYPRLELARVTETEGLCKHLEKTGSFQGGSQRKIFESNLRKFGKFKYHNGHKSYTFTELKSPEEIEQALESISKRKIKRDGSRSRKNLKIAEHLAPVLARRIYERYGAEESSEFVTTVTDIMGELRLKNRNLWLLLRYKEQLEDVVGIRKEDIIKLNGIFMGKRYFEAEQALRWLQNGGYIKFEKKLIGTPVTVENYRIGSSVRAATTLLDSRQLTDAEARKYKRIKNNVDKKIKERNKNLGDGSSCGSKKGFKSEFNNELFTRMGMWEVKTGYVVKILDMDGIRKFDEEVDERTAYKKLRELLIDYYVESTAEDDDAVDVKSAKRYIELTFGSNVESIEYILDRNGLDYNKVLGTNNYGREHEEGNWDVPFE